MGIIEQGVNAAARTVERLNHQLVTRRIHHLDSSRDPHCIKPVQTAHKVAAFIDGVVIVDLSAKHLVLEVAAVTTGLLHL